jgi:uncharacterized membrane protein YidH (DUF202 family)
MTRDPRKPTPDPDKPTPDAGVSAERTRLAWRRTVLSAGAVALLACRPAVHPDAGGPARLTAAFTMACWVLMVGISYRRNRGLTAAPPRPGRRSIGAYAVITMAFATLGGLVVML